MGLSKVEGQKKKMPRELCTNYIKQTSSLSHVPKTVADSRSSEQRFLQPAEAEVIVRNVSLVMVWLVGLHMWLCTLVVLLLVIVLLVLCTLTHTVMP